jgi:hypothetical protein
VLETKDFSARALVASEIDIPGWPKSWPQTLAYEGLTYTKDKEVVATRTGEVQFVEYTRKDDTGSKWLVIANE